MSPTIRPVPAMEPSQALFLAFGEGGTTSATGSPNLVTRIGLRVLRTRSRTARQVALNLEIAISSMMQPRHLYHSQDHGQPCWACCTINGAGKGCFSLRGCASCSVGTETGTSASGAYACVKGFATQPQPGSHSRNEGDGRSNFNSPAFLYFGPIGSLREDRHVGAVDQRTSTSAPRDLSAWSKVTSLTPATEAKARR
jgi:hypothetical protein